MLLDASMRDREKEKQAFLQITFNSSTRQESQGNYVEVRLAYSFFILFDIFVAFSITL